MVPRFGLGADGCNAQWQVELLHATPDFRSAPPRRQPQPRPALGGLLRSPQALQRLVCQQGLSKYFSLPITQIKGRFLIFTLPSPGVSEVENNLREEHHPRADGHFRWGPAEPQNRQCAEN